MKPVETPIRKVVPPETAASLPEAAASTDSNQAGEVAATPAPVEVAHFIKFENVGEVITFPDKTTYSFKESHLKTADQGLIAKLREAVKNPNWRIYENQNEK